MTGKAEALRMTGKAEALRMTERLKPSGLYLFKEALKWHF